MFGFDFDGREAAEGFGGIAGGSLFGPLGALGGSIIGGGIYDAVSDYDFNSASPVSHRGDSRATFGGGGGGFVGGDRFGGGAGGLGTSQSAGLRQGSTGGNMFSSRNEIHEGPYVPAQSAINAGIQGIEDLYGRGGFRVDPYTGQRVAGLSPEEQMGLGSMIGNARQGSESLRNAMGVVADVAGSGPQDTERLRKMAMGDAVNTVNDQFMSAGMEGSSLHESEAIEAAARGVAPYHYKANEDAMTRQLRAASLAPGIAQGATAMGAAEAGAGRVLTAQQQAVLDAERAQYMEQQSAPISEQQAFSQLASLYGGLGGTRTQDDKPSTWDIIGNIGGTALDLYTGFGGGFGGGSGGGFGGGSSMSTGMPGSGSVWWPQGGAQLSF